MLHMCGCTQLRVEHMCVSSIELSSCLLVHHVVYVKK